MDVYCLHVYSTFFFSEQQQCCSTFYDDRKWSDWLRALCRGRVIISKMASTRRLHSAALRDFVLLIFLFGSQQQVNPGAACEHFTFKLKLQVEEINIYKKSLCSAQKCAKNCAWRNTMRCAACSADILSLLYCDYFLLYSRRKSMVSSPFYF